VIRRVGCAELAELRSAYVDGALAERDRERLLSHLAGCAGCRSDVDELRRVRRLLATRHDEVGAPMNLSSRLISIADDDPAPQRRWAAALDPQRRRRRDRARAAVVTVAVAVLGLATLGGIGYVAAPPLTASSVGDPGAEALSEYGTMLASLPLTNPSVDAVAAIQPTALAVVPTPRAVTPSGVTRRLSADQAETRLDRAARMPNRVSFSGRQSYQAVRGDRMIVATVEVFNVRGQGMQLLVRDQTGRKMSARFVGPSHASRLTELALLAKLSEHYTLSGFSGSEVANRPATVIEARDPAAPADAAPTARWWIDDDSGLLVWQETYDETGRVQTSSGYQSLSFDEVSFLSHLPQTTVPKTTTTLSLSRTTDLAAQGWSPPSELAGLPLVRLRSDRAENPSALHLVYSDGLSVVSVFEQRGGLDAGPAGSAWDDGLGAFLRWGSASTATWQSGRTVFTVVSNGSPESLAEAVRTLPHEERPSRTTMDRVLAGWNRILGSR
jgi:anti-sigma factor RsiW